MPTAASMRPWALVASRPCAAWTLQCVSAQFWHTNRCTDGECVRGAAGARDDGAVRELHAAGRARHPCRQRALHGALENA